MEYKNSLTYFYYFIFPKNSTGIKIKIYIQTNMGFCIPKNYVVGHFIKQKPFIYEELTTYFLCLIEWNNVVVRASIILHLIWFQFIFTAFFFEQRYIQWFVSCYFFCNLIIYFFFCLSLIRPGILFFSLTSFSIISFFRLMENLNQKDPTWRENGKGFVESVTRLLERLLDYRNVGQVSIVESYFFLVKTEYFFFIFSVFSREKKEKICLREQFFLFYVYSFLKWH